MTETGRNRLSALYQHLRSRLEEEERLKVEGPEDLSPDGDEVRPKKFSLTVDEADGPRRFHLTVDAARMTGVLREFPDRREPGAWVASMYWIDLDQGCEIDWWPGVALEEGRIAARSSIDATHRERYEDPEGAAEAVVARLLERLENAPD